MVGISMSGEFDDGVIPEPGGDRPAEATDEEYEALELEQLRANVAESTARARVQNLHAQEIEQRLTHSRTFEPVELQISAAQSNWSLGTFPGAVIVVCMFVLLFSSPIHACAVGLLVIILQMIGPALAELVGKK